MAIVFSVKDGPRPGYSGPGSKIQLAELYRCSANLDTRYLGTEPPTFNEGSPSIYPLHVVVKVSASEVDSNKFDKIGFSLLNDIPPDDPNLLSIIS
jgi:hypothetical protein